MFNTKNACRLIGGVVLSAFLTVGLTGCFGLLDALLATPPASDDPPSSGLPVIGEPNNPNNTKPQHQAVPEPPPVAPVGEILTPAQIYAQSKDAIFQIIFQDGQYLGYGSGFFISSSGIAVTNHHVMNGVKNAQVVMEDGTRYSITGYYSYEFHGNDLAIIQVDGKGKVFDYLPLGNSDAVRPGDVVYAMGGPEGDPLTITNGIITRIVNEPLNFDIYSIEGMFRHNAEILGGSSGGPLINDRGQVIGVNAAGRDDVNAQFAIPANRVIPPASGARPNNLPIGSGSSTPQQPNPSNPGFLTQFPFIPDFLSISRNARLQMSGTPADLGHTRGDMLYDYFGFLYIYSLAEQHWIADTDEFDAVMVANGFTQQDGRRDNDTNEYWMYFYHSGRNVSLTYSFAEGYDILLIAVSNGNVYGDYFSGNQPPQQPPAVSLTGTWQCPDPPSSHAWFCRLVLSANGRFTDHDGDSGTYSVSGNTLTLDFDNYNPSTIVFELSNNGNRLTLFEDGKELTTLNRVFT